MKVLKKIPFFRNAKLMNIFKKIMQGAPRLLRKHKLARLGFARKYQTWENEWKCIKFTDEKKFNLDGPDGYKYFWADKNISENMYSQRQNAGGGIMVWGAISAIRKMELQIMNGLYNADRYIEMFDNACLLEEGNRLCPEKFIFQQDGPQFTPQRDQWSISRQWGLRSYPGQPEVTI